VLSALALTGPQATGDEALRNLLIDLSITILINPIAARVRACSESRLTVRDPGASLTSPLTYASASSQAAPIRARLHLLIDLSIAIFIDPVTTQI